MNQPQPQNSLKKSPPKTTGRIILKITTYFVGFLIAEFGLLGGVFSGNSSNVPLGCSVLSVDMILLFGSIFIFFRKGYYFHCLSALQYVWWISGTTIAFFMAFVLMFVFTDPNHNHIANIVTISILGFYGVSLMWIAHMKPPLAQQINESVYRILHTMPGKQIATGDLFARLQKEYKHLNVSFNRYLEDLDYVEPINVPGISGIVCRMKLPKQITVVPQTAPPVVRTPHPQTLSAPFIPPVSINQSINLSPVKNNPLGKPNQVSSANLSTTPPTIPVPTPSQTPTVSPQQIQRIIPTSPKPIDEVVPPASQAVPPAAIEPSSPKEPTPLSKEPKAITTFFCYAHSDEQLLNKLKTHLKPQQREGLLQIWYDRDISAGAEWKQEIEEQLNTAQIILLLVSPDFMASDYCYSIEMQRALERHDSGEARAIPIILRPVDWKITPLGKLQALPKDGKPITTWQLRDNAYLEVAQGIRAVVESFLTPPQQAKNQVPIQSNQQKQGAEVELVRARCTQGKLIITNKKISVELNGFGMTIKSQTLLRSSLSSIDSKLVAAPIFGKGGGVNLTFHGRGKELLSANLVPPKEAKEIVALLGGS